MLTITNVDEVMMRGKKQESSRKVSLGTVDIGIVLSYTTFGISMGRIPTQSPFPLAEGEYFVKE